jgi:hypothetical protein
VIGVEVEGESVGSSNPNKSLVLLKVTVSIVCRAPYYFIHGNTINGVKDSIRGRMVFLLYDIVGLCHTEKVKYPDLLTFKTLSLLFNL